MLRPQYAWLRLDLWLRGQVPEPLRKGFSPSGNGARSEVSERAIFWGPPPISFQGSFFLEKLQNPGETASGGKERWLKRMVGIIQ